MTERGRLHGVRITLVSVALAIACGGPTNNDLFATPPVDDDDFVVPVGNTGSTSSAAASVGGATSTVATSSTTLTTTEGGPTSTTASTSGTATATTDGGTGGTGTTPCGELLEWESGNYEQMFPAGTEFSFEGRRYLANEDITYTNPQCEPDAPAEWCAAWSTDLGPC